MYRWVLILVIYGYEDVDPPLGIDLFQTEEECYKASSKVPNGTMFHCYTIEDSLEKFPGLKWR